MLIGTVTKLVSNEPPHFVFMYETYIHEYYYVFRKIGPLWYLWAELDENMAEDACKMGLTECAEAFETKEAIERYLARKELAKCPSLKRKLKFFRPEVNSM